MREWGAALALLWAQMAQTVGAQDLTQLPFEQLLQTEVLTASRLAKQVSESPAAVSIVTADEIRRFGYRSLADVIHGMRGLYTTGDRRYEYLGGRGFGAPGDYTGRIMLLVDGTAVQDNLYNQAFLDHSGLIDLELIERVEYVPGTGSVSYGNNALLGIINVVTKKGTQLGGAQLALEGGSFGGRKLRLSWGQRFDSGLDVLLSASGLHSDGQDLHFPYFEALGINGGWARGLDTERSRRYLAKLEWEGLSLQAAHVSRTKVSPLPRRQNAFGLRYEVVDESGQFQLKYDFDLGPSLKSVSRLYYGRYEDRTLRRYVTIDPIDQFSRNANRGQWWGLDQKWVYTGWRGHTLVLGAELRRDFEQRLSAIGLNDAGEWSSEYFRYPYTNRTRSLYLADEVQLSSDWSANLGLRADQAHAIDCSVAPCIAYATQHRLSPRLALAYQSDSQRSIKASFSRAFRLPNPSEISSSTQSDLYRAEQIRAAELALQQELGPQSRMVASLYDYHLSDLRHRSDAGLEHFDGRSHTRGLELQYEGRWDPGWQLRLSGAWQRARDPGGRPLVNSPRHMAKLQLSAPLAEDLLRVGVEALHYGSRLTLPLRGDDEVLLRSGRRLGAMTLLNLTLSTPPAGIPGWPQLGQLSLSVKNLLNRRAELPTAPVRWDDSGAFMDSLQQDGRSVWLQWVVGWGR
ncbi:TonB-dependent receptor plug domain-containing protein [Inhella inkyongensis]|nr:TonB-dependent receptor [Inhella inkyongensis]